MFPFTQIPPPKPPPPELHFIPNPSNTEFVYLLGLEHVVDYITKDRKMSPFNQPFRCGQCKIDFTPVWKWEKQGKTGNATFQNTPGNYSSMCAKTHTQISARFSFLERIFLEIIFFLEILPLQCLIPKIRIVSLCAVFYICQLFVVRSINQPKLFFYFVHIQPVRIRKLFVSNVLQLM